MLLKLLAQGVAIDAQHLASDGLIHVGFFHDHFEHWALYRGQHHVVNRFGTFAFEVIEELVEVVANALGYGDGA